MNVLAISPFPPQKDGGSTSVREFFTRLSQRDYKIKVISYLTSVKISENLESIGLNLGTRMSLMRGMKFFIKAIRVGLKLNRENSFDLIYSKNITSPSFVAYFLSIFTRKPLIVHTSGADIQELDSVNQGFKITQGSLFLLTKFFRKRVLNKSSKIIANNHIDYQILVDLGYKDKAVLIRNGVDKQKFSSPKKIKKESLTLIFVGRPEKEKNPDHILEIAEQVNNRLILIGGSKEEFLKFGEISSNIELIGLTDKIEDYYKEADIFIQTSSSEGLSNALLESMSCRNVPLTYPSGDAIFLIKDGYNGFICNSVKEIVDKIAFLSDNQDKFLEMSENARLTIHEQFDWEDSANKMDEVFKKLARN